MPDVVLLHGLGADRRAWQRFERLLPDDWNVSALDLLGHGDAPHPPHGYSLDDHADYIASAMRDRHIHDASIVGHSYGAATGVALAATHPTLATQLVLLDPVVQSDTRAMTSGMRTPLAESAGTGTDQMMHARRNDTLPETVARLFGAESEALQRWIIDTWQRMAVGVIDELDTQWMRFAQRVVCPVTVIHGDVALGGAGDAAAAYFDGNASATRIAGAGHYLHATHARKTADAVVNAISTQANSA